MPAEFGTTVWGKAWMRTVEPTAVAVPNPALPRARGLARNHAVTALRTDPGCVEAEVAARATSYRVRIDIPLWDEHTREDAVQLVKKALADRRDLAPGDLPDTLHTDLVQHGIAVATSIDDLTIDCTCRPRREPCAHALAVVYLLSQRVDEQPVLAITLRGGVAGDGEPEDPDWVGLAGIDPATFYDPS